MASSVLAIVGGILTMAFQLWMDYRKGEPARKAKADALRQRSLDELHAATDGVRRTGTLPPQ